MITVSQIQEAFGAEEDLGRVFIREARADDREALRDMFDRSSRETIYFRFHIPWPTVPDWAIDLLVDGAGMGRRVIVAVAGAKIVGHAMYVIDERDGREAEVAVVVEDGRRSSGVGRRLMSEIADDARRAGVETLTCVTLGDNYRLLSIARRAFPGSRTSYVGGECRIRAPLTKNEGVSERRP